MRLFGAVLSLLIATVALAQENPPPSAFTDEAFVTAIQLTVRVTDARGETPGDLKPSDFLLFENGVERPIIGVEYRVASVETAQSPARTPALWQIVIWIDATSTSQSTIHREATRLAEQAEELTALGPVSVVWADPATQMVIEASRDASRVAAALEGLASRIAPDHIARMRREFLLAKNLVDEPRFGLDMEIKARMAVQQEAMMIGTARKRMMAWLGRVRRTGPRALFLVGDGYDLDPGRFYAGMVYGDASPDYSRLMTELQTYMQSIEHQAAAEDLASAGWTAFGIGGFSATNMADDATSSGVERARIFANANVTPDAVNAAIITPVTPSPAFLAQDSLAPMAVLASATGGSVIPTAGKLDALLDDLVKRIVVTYQVPRAPDTRPRNLELVALRAGLQVSAPLWASSTSPASVAEGRAIGLVEGADDRRGELPVAILSWMGDPNRSGNRKGTVEATVDLSPLSAVAANVGETLLRVSVAVGGDETLPATLQQTLEVDLRKYAKFRWSAPVEADAKKQRISVVFEELETGAWGAATAALDNAGSARAVGEDLRALVGSGWSLDREDALARAGSERKAVFALVIPREASPARIAPGKVALDAGVDWSTTPFVRLIAVSSGSGEPAFAVLDTTGREHFRLAIAPSGRRDPAQVLSQFVGKTARAARLLADGAALASAGKEREAADAFGLAYRTAGEMERAQESFERVRDLSLAGGDRAGAQAAEVQIGLVRLQGGDLGGALAQFESVAGDSASEANRAEALLGIGQVKLKRRDEQGAREAFAEAARLAPRGSEVRAAARSLAGMPDDEVPSARVGDASVKALQLMVRGRPPFAGRVDVQARVYDPAVDRVTFALDDVDLGPDDAPPFRRRIDLGEVPRPRRLRASALDARGAVIAEDLLLLNERHDHFWVSATGSVGADGVEAKAEIGVPVGRRVARLDFLLDGFVGRSLPGPPWQATIPGRASVLRALVHLDDGSMAEDALLLEPSGYAEGVEVRDVELYATVVNSDGEPVRGLQESDFIVVEEGREKPIHGFEFLEQTPWTAGIAIDSSGSMGKRMQEVRDAAREFAGKTIANGGRAFVVDFDTAPRLAHPTSAQRDSLAAAIGRISPDGETALWDAIIFSLLQLQGVDGKRALVVLSDGRDRTSRYRYADAERVARESGAAVYLIVAEDSAAQFDRTLFDMPERREPPQESPLVGNRRTLGQRHPRATRPSVSAQVRPDESAAASRLRGELDALARSTGGQIWFVSQRDSLGPIYEAIERQLRNQYVLTYRTTPPGTTDEWRKIEVRLGDRNVKAKTIAGYVAR